MKIDPRSHVPIYLQIAEEVRAAVAAGLFRPGEALPSLRALALEIQVNPNTVQRAYDGLEREGLIYSQRGRGLFVAERGHGVGPDPRAGRRPPGVGRGDSPRPGRRHERSGNPRAFSTPPSRRSQSGEQADMSTQAAARTEPGRSSWSGLTKRFGRTLAVDDLSLRSRPRQHVRTDRPQRRRQEHHDQDAHRRAFAHRRAGQRAGNGRLRRADRRSSSGSATCPRRTTSTAGCGSAR